MALTNTLNFLPEVFRSTTNQRFLGATMDQLVTDATNVPINGYIGRTFAPTYKLGDNYVPELTTQRANYQLEPSVVIKDDNGEVILNSEYIDLLQSIANNNGFNDNHQRLFGSTSYDYDGRFDYDKFVNYHNYYWLPDGPASVAVTSGATPMQAEYTVTRNPAIDGYAFSGLGGQPNQQLTLTRGGTYTFNINQPGYNFWIQTEPGTSGKNSNISTLTTRNVFGVANNGTDSGTITFTVPLISAQDFYLTMPLIDNNVSAAVTFNYSDIQNTLLSEFLIHFPEGLDGITNQLQNKTIIFINNTTDDSKWESVGVLDFNGFDEMSEPFDTSKFLPGIVPVALRQNIWKINLIPNGFGDYVIQLLPTITVAPQQRVFITSGKTYASLQFWLNNNYQYIDVPPITATADYLYYQDSSNPGFVGAIKLVDNKSSPIDVDKDIIGRSAYTSPNGVIFTNGLKILFDSLVTPSTYANNKYYVEGVGRAISLVPVDELVVPEEFGQKLATSPDYITITRDAQDRNPWSRSNRWFHVDVLNATAAYNQTDVDYGPNIYGRRAIIEFENDLQLFNFGAQAKANVDLITFVATDAFVEIEGPQTTPPKSVDGVTLTQDMRVVFANDYDKSIENEVWQVNIETINSQKFVRLVATVDDPVNARECVLINKGVVNGGKTFWFDGSAWHISQIKSSTQQAPLFDLVDASGYSFADTTVYPGSTFAGSKLFGYPVVTTGTNDSILGFPLKYQNFNNIGDIVFSNYYDTDQFTYISDTNAGTTSTVNCNSGYVVRNTGIIGTTKLNNWIKGIEPSEQYQVITKFYEGYVLPVTTTIEAVYPMGATVAPGNYPFVQIDVMPKAITTVPHIKVYLNNTLLNPNTDYQLIPYGVYHVVTLSVAVATGDKIDVSVLSDSISNLGHYEIPKNLDYNPLNKAFLPTTDGLVKSAITLGQLRTHYNKLLENTTVSPTEAIPAQDRYLKAQGGTLLQQSSPLIYAMTFLTDPIVNYVGGITLARQEYTRFKNKFLSLCTTIKGLDYNDPIGGVDTILQTINSVKNSSFPWYYSDMIPQGGNYNAITYTVLNARQTAYEISEIFNITELSNRAVLVYLNGVQLLADGLDFSFSQISPEIIINKTLAVGDTILIRDYFNTDGNFIPETPTKLGLAQDYPPSIFTDETYLTPTQVIRGHDGSTTPAFGDFRDNFLLELEKRIYNNVKSVVGRGMGNQYDTIPGRFRTTDYTLTEWNQLLTSNFLTWVGSNNIDYTTNSWFDANDPWTWNYNQSADSVDGSPLQGSWRAIYNYWYDTDAPHRTPWEMLGIAEIPAWWATRYGPAPYTNGNTTLWEDLERGYIWNGSNSAAYIDTRFARPGLSKFIPVDSAGNLLDPLTAGVVKQFDQRTSGDSFQVGQQGPVEVAWRHSSDYPFAIQQALAIARPAEYFSTRIDLSRFYTNPVTGQFSNVNNQKITPSLLTVNGDTTTVPGSVQRTAGYLNWITDYIKNLGIDPVAKIENYFKNFNVNLSYRVAGFTDQNLIKVTAEQTSPGSTNASVIIPDGNYSVYLNKSVPIQTISYSAVIVTKTETGYSVAGYDTTKPYFTILSSIATNNASTITVNDVTVKMYQNSSSHPTAIPYGTTFTSVQQVTDFLISYQRYLISQGFVFNQFDTELQQTRDWTLSVNEFLFWAQQGFGLGVLIVLNPVKDTLDVKTNGAVIDAITNISGGSRILDINFNPIKNNYFNVLRVDYPTGNQFQVQTVDGISTIAFAQLDLVQYESTLIFDNVDAFGDILYIPEQGTRQFRLKLTGAKTGLWDGALSATGYIYSNPMVTAWQPGVDYKQGDLVTFNNSYYTAPDDIVASQTFNPIVWKLISQNDLQTGLLPSFGHNAQLFQNIYDIDNPPQDENYQIFSAGLIGFRERPFLSNLGISIPTQTKFYQGYIHQKGTTNAITALTNATFGTLNSTVGVYEEWAFQAGRYGDINNNLYTEFVLDQSVFKTNPVAFTANANVHATYSSANIIVNLAVTGNTITSNVYTASNLTSTGTALYSNRTSTAYSHDLPNCGYVNLADVEYQIFDIKAISAVPPSLKSNLKIWVAKDFTPGWNVYRTANILANVTSMSYELDNFAELTFDGPHGLNAKDYFVLQNFNKKYSIYNSMYQVVSVPDSANVVITIGDTTTITSAGGNIIANSATVSAYSLKSQVVQNNTGIGVTTPSQGWIVGDRQWVNNDTAAGATGWAVYTYNGTSWVRTRQQQPKVDIASINRTFIYNKTNNVILAALDYIDPAKGKVLNLVDVDIDYQLTTDPAYYNNGNLTLQPNLSIRSDYHWGPNQVGKIWWDLNAVRYIDYEQDELIYRLNQWGTVFPGSQILVYEWVESLVPPSLYITDGGLGTPLHTDDSSYSTYAKVGPTGLVTTTYYFWVSGKTTINTDAGKSNSVYNVAAAIQNPQSQGIPYAMILRDDTVSLYNVNSTLTGQNSVIHLGSRSTNAGLIHSEYALVQEGNPQSQIPAVIDCKLIDSLAGQDSAGNAVPDPALTPAQAYGISIRPRQSMFIDRTLALNNYITMVNSKLLTYPVIERKLMTTLNREEAIPAVDTGTYNQVVATRPELDYVDTTLLPHTGYNILVTTDVTNSNKWAIYTWVYATTSWNLTQVQSYKTNLYWKKVDWYQPGYDYTVAPNVTVNTRLDFGKLTLVADTYIKVLNNGNNQFEVYYIDNTLTQNLVGLQNGTLQISTGTIPALEMREIATAVQRDIFIDDLSADYNQLFFTMVKYALSEQKNIEWAFKTSFLSATQYIRALVQTPSYVTDNQSYYLDYINEVKPYRTTVREFVIDYQGNDQFGGDITDFDLPPYWDANLQIYRSPNGEQPYDAALLSTGVYSQWNDNYKYGVVDVIIENPGTGYLFPPQIIFNGNASTSAKGYATLNGSGGISSVIITNPGKGYTSNPDIIINGTGSGAVAYPVVRNVFDNNNQGHNVVRSINTTIKFDRVNYTNPNTFVSWNSLTSANVGQVIAGNTILVLDNNFYQLANNYTVNSSITFPTANVIQISSNFNNANDRIVAYNGNVDLRLTQKGLEYPGVTVDGNTYLGSQYDSLIQSRYTDIFGISPNDIIVDGGKYVDIFESYAPEELVPGRAYDNLAVSMIDTDFLGFRVTEDMNGYYNSYRIAKANTAILTANLLLTDTAILVDNASKLPMPSTTLNSPGVVVINGEKITYWRNYALETKNGWVANVVVPNDTLITYSGNTYLTTGNVYGAYFANIVSNVQQVSANTIAQIRRAVDGTSPANVHIVGSQVIDSSAQQIIPNSANSNVVISTTTTYKATDVVSLGLELTGNISANIGDIITQMQTVDSWKANINFAIGTLVYNSTLGNSYTVTGNVYGATFASILANVTYAFVGSSQAISTMTLLQTVTNASLLPVILTAGTIQGVPITYDLGRTAGATGTYDHGSTDPEYTFGTVPTSNIVTWQPSGSITTWTANTVIAPGTLIYYVSPKTNYTVYKVTGNVYGESFNNANVSSNVLAVTYTYYSGNSYAVNGNIYAPYFANIAGNVGKIMTGNTGIPPYNLSITYTGSGDGFDNTVGTVRVTSMIWDRGTNGVPGSTVDTGMYIANSYILGKVNSTGQVTITAGNTLSQSNVWYSRGVGTITNGLPLVNSTTFQAEFLKARRTQ
jgi:hypothetical protein